MKIKPILDWTLFPLFFLLIMLTNYIFPVHAATTLSLGADYRVRGVSIEGKRKNIPDLDYYSSRLQGYLITDLSRNVEAQLRVQSITPWGLENSTSPLTTRYPDANGDLWVQNAFVRLPDLWRNNLTLTIGRQPILWGDGLILSDDDLGFNAVRAQLQSPWERLEFNIDAFTAKISDGLQQDTDTDLHGVQLDFNRRAFKWEFMGLLEDNNTPQSYEMGIETTSVTATKIKRHIFGVRVKTILRDAFLRGEYYRQAGNVKRMGQPEFDLGGEAFSVGAGAKTTTRRFGRFGTALEFFQGSGDDGNTMGEDEAFRPTFASRWDGLERKGFGKFFAATLSDVYSSSAPFSPATSVNDGLPDTYSGIQTIHFNLESTPLAKWTFTFDFYQYKAMKNVLGDKDLGIEFDLGVEYRFSGLVSFRGWTTQFKPGDAFEQSIREDGAYSSIEVEILF